MTKAWGKHLKILMVSNDFLPNPGGVANHIAQLSMALVRRNHNVHVLHFCYEDVFPYQETISGVEITRAILATNLANKPGKLSALKRYWVTLTTGTRELQVMNALLQPDVIHWHDFYHTSLAMNFIKTSARRVLTNHASRYLEQIEAGFYYPYLLKGFARCADLLLAPSEELMQQSECLGKPCYFIPNGVDVEMFKPVDSDKKQAARAQFNLPQDALIVIAPRRLDPKNGLRYFIEALPQVLATCTNAYFVIAGGGDTSLEQEYMNLAKQLHVEDRLIITGNLAYADMPKIMSAADLGVMPSLYEAVSLAALEMLSAGLPVIASDVGGLPYIIDDKIGELVPPKDPEKLAISITQLLQDDNKRLDKSQAARPRVIERFSWDYIAKLTEEIYHGSRQATANLAGSDKPGNNESIT